MRPDILSSLFRQTTSLKGIGPRIAKLIEKVAGPRLADLCWHLPVGLIDRRFQPGVAAAPDGVVVTLTVRVDRHLPPPNRRVPYRVECSDDTGTLTLVFFHARADYLTALLPLGATRVVSGRMAHFNDQPQMPHPDHVVPVEEFQSLPAVEPVYRLTEGLTPKPLARAIATVLADLLELPEWQDAAWLRRQEWTDWRAALRRAHAPETEADLAPTHPARQRLAYDELLANQLALALVRAQMRRLAGRRIDGDGELRAKVAAALPYALTSAQTRTLSEIAGDMAGPSRMLRLLQGDVGSGKTVVALMAMLIAVESGAQAALMAPTEILARQHFETLSPLCAAAGVELTLLTGRLKGKARREVLARLAAGEAVIAVGTHALFQDTVTFRDLAMVVIDEQHRFGVHQRLLLGAKGKAVDVLVMTATPIPRTLTLTAYGDMDVSKLDEKPPGRAAVDTRSMPLSRLGEVVTGLRRVLADGARVYWVCPLIEESDELDLAAAEDRHAALRQQFGDRVGLVHGRMKGPEKDQVMDAFAAGDIDILVATTVIEVGVDVAEATVMVIEHAERFGLAQLHQLRGRVGRGGRPGTCVLLFAEPLSETARARIRTMRETDDGFVIAEEDMRLRGAGEVLGTRQSGLPTFRLADLDIHRELMQVAHDDCRLVLETDPDLQKTRGQALRVLLYLFERDAAVKYLRSG